MELYKCICRELTVPEDEYFKLYSSLPVNQEWYNDAKVMRTINQYVMCRTYTLYMEYLNYNTWHLPFKNQKPPTDWRIDYNKLREQVFHYYSIELYQKYLEEQNK
jgi:hypothetical protein